MSYQDALLEAPEHEAVWEETILKQPTCTKSGLMDRTCPICQDTEKNAEIKATGHNFENGVCTVCGESQVAVGGTFEVDDCWKQYNEQSKFDNFSLICEVLTSPKDGKGTVAVTGWKGAAGNTSSTKVYILIPETVTDDFGNKYTVTEVTANFQMNDSNQNKGKLVAFYLKAPQVKELSVNSMFANQTNLQILDLGNSLEVIGVGCFSGCKKLDYSRQVVLPETLREIGIGAFKGVSFSGKDDKILDIPASVTYIGSGAFENSNLETVIGGEGLTSLNSTVFQNSMYLTTVGFPNVTEFESAVFDGTPLTNVGWDWSKVISIGDSAFDGCYGLSGDLVLSGDCKLGETTFIGTSFSSVTIGEGMTGLPDYTFYSCGNLLEINLPNSLTSIGKYAFDSAGWAVNKGQVNPQVIQVKIGSDGSSKLNFVGENAFTNASFNIVVATSEDAVGTAYNLEGNGNTVIFTEASIETTKTASDLQAQIDAATATPETDDDTIVLDANYDIDVKVVLPTNANITLVGGENGAVLKASLNDYMFTVPAGTSLTLGEGLSCMVRTSRLVEAAGTFKLNGAVITGGEANTDQGVIHITDGGKFYLNTGSISDATVKGQYAGTILLSTGAEMIMNGGSISCNVSDELNSGAGVTICQGATFTMEGGNISGNTGFRGAGVLVFGGTNASNPAYDEATVATFIMNDGSISNNHATGYQGNLQAADGGVYVQENARFIMNGGTISGNISSHQGGGVATQDEDGNGGVFIMNDGVISGNKAVNGGGVYSYSKAVQLLAGRIENNMASGLGGGMYVSTNPYSIELGSALIIGNSATTMGGGIWSCPIGTIDFADGSFAIYDNTAGGAGDDVAALNKTSGTITTLGSQMPGGGVMAWYKDGSISALSMDGNDWGAIAADSVRYATGDSRVEAPIASEKAFAAKSIVTEDANALVNADLVITGNSAAQGGGVGSNGIVKLSGSAVETDKLSVNKVWAGDCNPNQPGSVTVQLVMVLGEKEYVIDSAALSASGDWQFIFTFQSVPGATYTVRELVPSGYETTTKIEGNQITITNTYEKEEPSDPSDPSYPPVPDPDPSEPEEIPDESVPETSVPEETPEEIPEEIPEESTPTTSLPAEEIPEDETPLVSPPKTGSSAGSVCGALILSAAALLVVVTRRKK